MTQDRKPKRITQSSARSIAALAREIGVARQTIYDWRTSPRAPLPNREGEHDIAAWREFAKSRSGRASRMTDSPELFALKLRKLAAEVEERELRVAAIREHYVPTNVISERLENHVTEARNLLNRMIDAFVVEVTGCEIIEVHRAGRDFVDSYIATMRRG